MKLLNTLKTSSWNSLQWQSRQRPRLRRKSAIWSPAGCLAAEVLEQRALLSATVNLTTSANGAIQLTSNTAHGEQVSLGVHRNGANVEFTVLGGTLHNTSTNANFAAGQTLDIALATIKSIAVNLGAGFDTFQIYDLSTTGNITFSGLGGGTQSADGWDLEVFNDFQAPADNTIGGSIIANLGTATASANQFSLFKVQSASVHNLTVNGNVSVADATSSNPLLNEIVIDGLANLVIGGSVNLTSSGSGNQGNTFLTEKSTGRLTVGRNVTITSSGAGLQSNGIAMGDGAASLAVTGAVTINATGSTRKISNVLSTGIGSMTLGSVAMHSSGPSEQENILTARAADLTVNKTVVLSSSGAGIQSNQIFTNGGGAGKITTGSVTINSSGAGTQSNSIVTDSAGTLTVNGSVALSSSGPAQQSNFVGTFNDIRGNSPLGNLTVTGNITIASSGSGDQTNSVSTLGNFDKSGNLLVMGNVSVTESGDGFHDVEISTDQNTGSNTILGSVSVIDSGNGMHQDRIWSDQGGDVNLKGPVTIHDMGNGLHEHLIFADGFGLASGNIALGAVTVSDSGAGSHTHQIYTARKGGTIAVNGSVTIVDAGTGPNSFDISAADFHPGHGSRQVAGRIQINGSVSYDNHANTTGGDTVAIGGDVAEGATTTITGSLTLNLASAPGHGNSVELGLLINGFSGLIEKGRSLIIGGALNIQSGAGVDQIDLWGTQVKGLITLNSGLGTRDTIDIEGSEFDGAATTGRRGMANTITMSGNNATLYIADAHGHGWDPTFFAAALKANLPGAAVQGTGQNDLIQIGNGDGLTFNQQLFVVGGTPKTPGGVSGTLSIDGPITFNLNGVAQALPVVTNWKIVSGI
jgi:hypothetical protein